MTRSLAAVVFAATTLFAVQCRDAHAGRDRHARHRGVLRGSASRPADLDRRLRLLRSVDGGAEIEVPFDGSLRLELPAGPHELTLVTRPANDVLLANEEREFFDVSAECTDSVEVPSGGEVQVTYHATGGEDCRVTINEG